MRFELVFFDCDSTLSTLEGIDELAYRAGVAEEVARLTTEAMEGRIALEDVYGKRLDAVRPTAADLDWLGARYCETVVSGAAEVIEALHDHGCEVHVISGGVKQPVVALAKALGIAAANVHAVEVFLDANGSYLGWDDTAPTARSGGKPEVIAAVAAGRSCAMVGDGVTDLEAAAAGAFVVGFGGVVSRVAVREGADAWVASDSLNEILAVLTAH